MGTIQFNPIFLRDVKMEGWRKTRFGWYLRYYSNKWHKHHSPLNAQGQPLKIGIIAADQTLASPGTLLTIPELEAMIDHSSFVASDISSRIKNKHLDVYTGEDHTAKIASWKVTGIPVIFD